MVVPRPEGWHGKADECPLGFGLVEPFCGYVDWFTFVPLLSSDLTYYKPDEIELQKGEYIRIIGGKLDGVKGQLVRIKGKRAKQLVVTIPDILSVATVCVEPEYIQRLSKEEFIQENQ